MATRLLQDILLPRSRYFNLQLPGILALDDNYHQVKFKLHVKGLPIAWGSIFSQKESQQLHGNLEAGGNQTACYEIYVVTLLASFTLLISYFSNFVTLITSMGVGGLQI